MLQHCFYGNSKVFLNLFAFFLYSGQPPDDLLREAKNTGRFFKQVGSIYPGIEMQNGPISAYRILTEEEIETVIFLFFLRLHICPVLYIYFIITYLYPVYILQHRGSPKNQK